MEKQKAKKSPKVPSKAPSKSFSKPLPKPVSAPRTQIYRALSLPRLPRTQMRDQSVYEALARIDVHKEI